MTRLSRNWLWLALPLWLAGCAGAPAVPDWQMQAHAATQSALQAYLRGDRRVEVAEFARARAAIASTGRLELMARFELLRCAARVASLVLEPCAGFEALRPDAAVQDRVYADYLAGRLQAADIAQLPEGQRAVAQAGAHAQAATSALQGMTDPLARLVAAGVLFQGALADPTAQALAVQTASAQGWRRPLLAWLHLQLRAADAAGEPVEVARLRRRIALVQGELELPRP